jgi:hypothetical protein
MYVCAARAELFLALGSTSIRNRNEEQVRAMRKDYHIFINIYMPTSQEETAELEEVFLDLSRPETISSITLNPELYPEEIIRKHTRTHMC